MMKGRLNFTIAERNWQGLIEEDELPPSIAIGRSQCDGADALCCGLDGVAGTSAMVTIVALCTARSFWLPS